MMPPKAYLLFESDSDADFRFLLAYKLKKFAWEVDELPHQEYIQWYAWLGRRHQEQELAAKKGRV